MVFSALLAIGIPGTLRAITDATNVNLARWHRTSDQSPFIEIELKSQLTSKQKNLIESGFSTFSMLEVIKTKGDEPLDEVNPDQILFKTACTVRFDTWQERYELATIDKNITAATVKTFDDYASKCLTASLSSPAVVNPLLTGSTVVVSLRIDQISAEKSSEIKEWIVRQQTGIMQGLFSHMLGEIKLSERIDVKVTIPPLPGIESRAEVVKW